MSGLVVGFAATVAAMLLFFVLTFLQLRRVTGASEPIDEGEGDETPDDGAGDGTSGERDTSDGAS